MPIFNVGSNQTYKTIDAAMAAAADGDTIVLQSGFKNKSGTVTHTGMTITGDATSTGIVLHLATSPTIATVTLTGAAPIEVIDGSASNGSSITGNDGNNVITVTNGVDAVNGGLGSGDRLVVDYALATGAITGDSTTNFTESGGGGRSVTITNGTFEHFTINTGSGADTITTYAGDDIINTGNGASTVTAGQGANRITGGADADTVTALDGGNYIDGGGGANTLTSGSGNDTMLGGLGADTIVAGGGADLVTTIGGLDTVDNGAGDDRLVINYKAMTTAITGVAPAGNLISGYSGSIADLSGNSVAFQNTENFTFTGGLGSDTVTTGDGIDFLNGGKGNDTLDAAGGVDVLKGGKGADELSGGGGHDSLIGGKGKDTFAFRENFTAADSDTVKHFSHRADTFLLGSGPLEGFSALTVAGVLAGSNFHEGAKAHDADDHIIYNEANGNLYYDADGKGGTDQVLFAKVNPHTNITHTDFVVELLV